MDHSTAYKKLVYEHEVLWARYEIRDHHLKKIGEQIYDDIGQVLSLVRIQLCRTSTGTEAATESGELVGSAIRGLRAMHRSFYPETELRENGLLKTLAHELDLSRLNTDGNGITTQGTPRELTAGTQLIVFRMLQEILCVIEESGNATEVGLHAAYDERVVTFTIQYSGDAPQWTEPVKTDPAGATRLRLPERAALLEGVLSIEREEAGFIRIALTVPFKTSVYGQ